MFKEQLFKIFILLSLFFSVSASWKLKRSYGKTSIYTAKNNTRLTLNYSTTVPRKKNMDIDLVKYVEKHKERMLKFINISDWKVSKREIKKRNDHTLIIINGSYNAPDGNLVFFTELHFYKSDRRLQALLTNSDKKKLSEINDEKYLQGFKNEYGF